MRERKKTYYALRGCKKEEDKKDTEQNVNICNINICKCIKEGESAYLWFIRNSHIPPPKQLNKASQRKRKKYKGKMRERESV